MPTPKKRYLDSTPAVTKQRLAKMKSGIPVTYFTQSDAISLLADNPNRTVVLDEVTVKPYKKLPMQSELFQGITNQTANERADEYVNRVTPTAEDLFNIGFLGGLNNLSPAQWARRAYDLGEAIKGNMSWDKFGNNWFYGNKGLVSDKYAQEHPYASAAINLAGDIGAVGTLSALRKLPKYATLMEAENRATQEATALKWRDMLSNSVKRTRLGDVEVDNPGLYYHQSDAGKAKNFVSTGRMRTPLEEYWLAKEEAGEHIPIKLRTGIEPGYPQDPGSAMFSQGKLWYGLTPNKPDLLVTAKEMPIANKNASIMSDKASLKALYEQGTRRVTNDNIYTQGPHTSQNTAAYTWEPKYGYRRVSTEDIPTLNWADATRTTTITAENAASITPKQWNTAHRAAYKRGDKAEGQRLWDLWFRQQAKNNKLTSENNFPVKLRHNTDSKPWNIYDESYFNSATGDGGFFGKGLYATGHSWGKDAYGKNTMYLYGYMENPAVVPPANVKLNEIPENFTTSYIAKDFFNRGISKEDYVKNMGKEELEWSKIYPELISKAINNTEKADGIIVQREASRLHPFDPFNEVVLPKGTHIKLAEPFTLDDKGRLIDLTDRANFSKNDNRYGLIPIIGGGVGYGLYNKKSNKNKNIR